MEILKIRECLNTFNQESCHIRIFTEILICRGLQKIFCLEYWNISITENKKRKLENGELGNQKIGINAGMKIYLKVKVEIVFF